MLTCHYEVSRASHPVWALHWDHGRDSRHNFADDQVEMKSLPAMPSAVYRAQKQQSGQLTQCATADPGSAFAVLLSLQVIVTVAVACRCVQMQLL